MLNAVARGKLCSDSTDQGCREKSEATTPAAMGKCNDASCTVWQAQDAAQLPHTRRDFDFVLCHLDDEGIENFGDQLVVPAADVDSTWYFSISR